MLYNCLQKIAQALCVGSLAAMLSAECSAGPIVPPEPVRTESLMIPAEPPMSEGHLPAPSAKHEVVTADWQITITPVKSNPTKAQDYQRIYDSIPFRRAEYLANPSYRHDATMELMFGHMRQTVINRTDNPQRVINPRPVFTQPYRMSRSEINTYVPWWTQNGVIPFLSPVQ